MHNQNTNTFKRLITVGLCGLGLWAGSAAAHDDGLRHQARQLDLRGDRIEHRLDRKGDRIERRFERRARELRAQGRYAEARRLVRKGHQIDRRLDARGERINRRLDRQADRLLAQWRHEHRHELRYGDRHAYRDYRPRHHHDPELVLSVDLGHWVIRP